MSQFALRPVEVSDLDAILEQMRDPESVRMRHSPLKTRAIEAPSTPTWQIMSSSENRIWAIIRDARLVGTIGSYISEGATEVTYWIDRTCWGKGSPRGRSACSSRRSRFGRSGPCRERQRGVATSP
jgi:RimJ/RimL family protein N-acetyltransferase